MTKLLQQCLDAPGCERIKDFYAVGPVQRAAVESFVEALAQQEQPSKTERQIRRMFCVTYASTSSPYMDDGEAQDNSMRPYIDFLRDSPEEIQSKMTERAIAKHKAQQEQPAQEPAQTPCGYLDEFGNFENTLMAWMNEEPGVTWAPVYTHPAPTQPALSDAQALLIAQETGAFDDLSLNYETEKVIATVKAVIEAHCRGGAK